MSDVQIHPTAIVDAQAEIGAGTIIGPYCIVAAGVVLGPDCWLQHHVTLCGPMTAGARNKFYAYCSIGQQTQDLKYQGEPTYLEIGDENSFREFVTVNRSTTSAGKTRIGNRGNFLAYSHIGHDCDGGRRGRVFQQRDPRRACPGRRSRGHGRADRGPSILPDRPLRDHGRLLENRAGRSALHDRGWKSGQGARHQSGRPGAERFPPESVKWIKEAFRLIYRSKYNTRQAIDAIRDELPSSAEINQIVEFIEQTERGIIR